MTKLEKDHSKMVKSLVKSGEQIKAELTSENCNLTHAVLGISGEAGWLLDSIKKVVIYRKPIDRKNIVEELGDLEFYMQQLRAAVGITREETLQGNMDKLAERYEKFQYTNAAAIARADKA